MMEKCKKINRHEFTILFSSGGMILAAAYETFYIFTVEIQR
jgi:hypothetical protein